MALQQPVRGPLSCLAWKGQHCGVPNIHPMPDSHISSSSPYLPLHHRLTLYSLCLTPASSLSLLLSRRLSLHSPSPASLSSLSPTPRLSPRLLLPPSLLVRLPHPRQAHSMGASLAFAMMEVRRLERLKEEETTAAAALAQATSATTHATTITAPSTASSTASTASATSSRSTWFQQYLYWVLALNPLLTLLGAQRIQQAYDRWKAQPLAPLDQLASSDSGPGLGSSSVSVPVYRSGVLLPLVHWLSPSTTVAHVLQSNCNMFLLQQSAAAERVLAPPSDSIVATVAPASAAAAAVDPVAAASPGSSSLAHSVIVWPFRFGSLVPVNAWLVWVLLNNPAVPFLPGLSVGGRQVVYEAINRLYNISYDFCNRGERPTAAAHHSGGSSSPHAPSPLRSAASRWEESWHAARYFGAGLSTAVPTLYISYHVTRLVQTALSSHLARAGRAGTMALMAARCIPPVLATSIGHAIDISTANREILYRGAVLHKPAATTVYQGGDGDDGEASRSSSPALPRGSAPPARLVASVDPITGEPLRSREAALKVIGVATAQKAATGASMLLLGVTLQHWASGRAATAATVPVAASATGTALRPPLRLLANAAQMAACGLAVWTIVPGTMATAGQQWMTYRHLNQPAATRRLSHGGQAREDEKEQDVYWIFRPA